MASSRSRHVSIETIRALLKQKRWTFDVLMRKAVLNPKTMKSVINGNTVYKRTIEKIAGAFGVTEEEIEHGLLTPELEPPSDVLGRPMSFSATFNFFLESVEDLQPILAVLREMAERIQSKKSIKLLDSKLGSVIVTLEMLSDDVIELVTAFCTQQLNDLNLVVIELPSGGPDVLRFAALNIKYRSHGTVFELPNSTTRLPKRIRFADFVS